MAYEKVVKLPEFFRKIRQYLFKSRPRTFIVPTPFGLLFAVLCLFLFLLAAGSGNNLVFGYVIFLISIALVGVYLTNHNIDSLRFKVFPDQFLFAKESNFLLLEIQNTSRYPSVDIKIEVQGEKKGQTVHEVPAFSKKTVRVSWSPLSRGYLNAPVVKIQSSFPFGLLRAWHLLFSSERYLVFPLRDGSRDFPKDFFGALNMDSTGLFKEHKLFESSDSLMRMDWRVSARRQNLYVKKFEERKIRQFSFSWEQTEYLGIYEKRISQLTLWVDEAEKQGIEYSLRLTDFEVPFGKGLKHWEDCMKALALLGSQGSK